MSKLTKKELRIETNLLKYIKKNINDKDLEILTRDDHSKLDKRQLTFYTDLGFINLDKKSATEKELSNSLGEVTVLMILELFRRKKILKYKNGYWKETEAGIEKIFLVKAIKDKFIEPIGKPVELSKEEIRWIKEQLEIEKISGMITVLEETLLKKLGDII